MNETPNTLGYTLIIPSYNIMSFKIYPAFFGLGLPPPLPPKTDLEQLGLSPSMVDAELHPEGRGKELVGKGGIQYMQD